MTRRVTTGADFMTLISPELPEGQGLVYSIQNDKTLPSYGWLKGGDVPEHATHWSTGIFEVAETGEFISRTIGTINGPFVGAIGIVADDVGEKGDGIPDLEPFCRLETKPGSEQLVYLTKEPMNVDDARLANLILQISRWADTDGNNPVRLARLPGSLPPKKEHEALLLECSGVKYHTLDLLCHMWASLTPKQQQTVEQRLSMFKPTLTGFDPVLDWFNKFDWMLGKVDSEGWVKIRCPNFMNHTDQDDSGTSYHVGTNYETRSFTCRHSSCRGRLRKADILYLAKVGGARMTETKKWLRQRRTRENGVFIWN